MRFGGLIAIVVGIVAGVIATLFYSRKMKGDAGLRALDDQHRPK